MSEDRFTVNIFALIVHRGHIVRIRSPFLHLITPKLATSIYVFTKSQSLGLVLGNLQFRFRFGYLVALPVIFQVSTVIEVRLGELAHVLRVRDLATFITDLGSLMSGIAIHKVLNLLAHNDVVRNEESATQ